MSVDIPMVRLERRRVYSYLVELYEKGRVYAYEVYRHRLGEIFKELSE